jgi:hypothetical protein
MSRDNGELTEADGPLIGAALDRATEVDSATTPGQRRKAWLRLVPAAAVALLEGSVRESFVWGAIASSLLAIVFGSTSGVAAWAVTMTVSGVAGMVLVFWSIAKHWAFGRQWTVLLGVLAVQIVLMVSLWRTH